MRLTLWHLFFITSFTTKHHSVQTEDPFPKNCTELVQKMVTITITKTTYYSQHTCSGILWWKKCRYVKRSRTSYVLSEIPTYHEKKACCTRFIERSDGSCTPGCPSGKYGETCDKNCTCPETALENCDKVNGTCTCKQGKIGINCTENCDNRHYGMGCSNICLCENNGTCDPVDGSCNCTYPGYSGPFCEKECEKGWYGYNCSLECSCLSSQTCDHKFGICTCKAGLTGQNCMEVCKNFTFGPMCSFDCLCSPANTECCNAVNGTCVCKPGFEGSRCEAPCRNGRYGKKCELMCNCSDSFFCEPEKGRCINECVCNEKGTNNCDNLKSTCECERDFQNEACFIANESNVHQIEKFMKTICSCQVGDTYCKPRDKVCKCKRNWFGEQCEHNRIHTFQTKTATKYSIIGGSIGAIFTVCVIFATVCMIWTKYKQDQTRKDTKTSKKGKQKLQFMNAAYSVEANVSGSDNLTADAIKAVKMAEYSIAEPIQNKEHNLDYGYNHIAFTSNRPEHATTSVYSHISGNQQPLIVDDSMYDSVLRGRSSCNTVTDGSYGVIGSSKSTTDNTYDAAMLHRSTVLGNDDDDYSAVNR